MSDQIRTNTEYILTEIRVGIDQIELLEKSAREMSLAPSKKREGKVRSLGAFGLLFLEQFMPWYEQSLIANMTYSEMILG